MFSIRFNSRTLCARVILCDLRGEKVVFADLRELCG
jgi:hypothetical protein